MGAAARRAPAPAWRPSWLALCLLPVALPLALLCLPLLCVVVAVVRFRRRRSRRRAAARDSSGCRLRGGAALEPEGEAHRAALLHKYLQDQMELVGADAQTGTTPWTGEPSSLQNERQR